MDDGPELRETKLAKKVLEFELEFGNGSHNSTLFDSIVDLLITKGITSKEEVLDFVEKALDSKTALKRAHKSTQSRMF